GSERRQPGRCSWAHPPTPLIRPSLSDQAKPASLGQNVFIVQGELSDPAHLRAHMSADQAISTPVEASFRELAQVEQRNVAMQSQQALTQEQDEQVKVVQRV
nr:hypothetical protein [Xanthomonas campestris pv. campestris]